MAHEVVAVQLPAQAAPFQVANLVAGHLSDGFGPQQPHPVEYPAIEIELREAAEVRGRGENARVAGNPAQRPGVLIVDLAPDHAAADGVLVLRGRDARLQVSRWPVHRLVEMQRSGDRVADHTVQAGAGHLFDQMAKGDQAQVTVAEQGPGRIKQWRAEHALQARRGRRLQLPQLQIVGQATGVGQ